MSGWSSESIAGRMADVFVPSGSVRAVLLFLHPHGNETLAHPAARSVWTPLLDAAGLACCCPEASGTWWSSRIYTPFDSRLSAEMFLVEHVAAWMADRWRLSQRAIGVAGISMGGQGALRLGFKYPERFPIVASIAGAIDYHLCFDEYPELPQMYRSREHCRQDTATLHVTSSQTPRHIWFACDPRDRVWYPGNDRLHEKLNAIGVAHTADLGTSLGGHSWDYFNAMARPMLDFITTALVQESRRLL